MRRSKYDVDAEALDALYQAAYAELARRHAMDDDAKSRLITLVLECYYAALDDSVVADLRAATASAISRFEAAAG